MFYLFDQNNSGGGFVYDPEKGISVQVWIEADSADSANRKAQEIGIYFDLDYEKDCPCCGSRWEPVFDDEGEDHPSYYGSPLTGDFDDLPGDLNIKWIMEGYNTFVHYQDGTVKGFLK